MNDEQLTIFRRRNIGFIFQNYNLVDELAEKPVIAKTRTKIPFAGFVWEVDEFFGDNEGLVMAEIELPSVDASFEKPEWIGEEVTGDPRYYNSMLARNPYKNWRR